MQRRGGNYRWAHVLVEDASRRECSTGYPKAKNKEKRFKRLPLPSKSFPLWVHVLKILGPNLRGYGAAGPSQEGPGEGGFSGERPGIGPVAAILGPDGSSPPGRR
eukprot:sb/3477888/